MSKVQPLWPDQQAARIATDAELDAIRAELADITTGALPDGSVTNAKLANMPAGTVKARLSSTGVPQDVTLATLKAALAIVTGDISGLGALATLNALANVTQLGAGGTPGVSTFLRGDFTWAMPAGEGPPFDDDGSLLQNLADPTKELRLALAAIATGTQRVWTVPDQDLDLTPGGSYQAAGSYQPLDADLTALAGMTDPAGLLASALQPADIAAGAITPATGTLDLTGAAGEVLTLDGSGNIAPAAASGGAINQYEVLARLAAGSGAPSGLDPADLTEEAEPATGDWLFGWSALGALIKIDPENLPSAGGAPTGAQYLALAAHASLTAERVFAPGVGLSAADGGANSTYDLRVQLGTVAGVRTSFDLANDLIAGVGTLSLDEYTIDIFGNTAEAANLTLPAPADSGTLNQAKKLVTSGTWAHTVTLLDDAGTPNTILVLQPNFVYFLRWRGTGATPRWNVEGWIPRILGTSAQYIRGDGILAALSTLGAVFDPVEDAADYSVTPFTALSEYNIQRIFSGAQNHIIEFPTGLSTDPAAYGSFTAPLGNTLSIRAVTGVSINNIAGDGSTIIWVVPPSGKVFWAVIDPNTIQLWGDARPILLQEHAEPATPAAGLAALYVDSADSLLKLKKDDGTVSSPTGFDSTTAFGAGRTGESNRTLVQRIQENINVQDFGIVGDGTVTDNTAFINAACVAANNVGGRAVLYFPPAANFYGFTGAALTTLAKNISVIMDQGIRFNGAQASGTIWQIGSVTENSRVQHKLFATNGGSGVTTPGQVMLYLPNHIFSDVNLHLCSGFYTAVAIHAVGAQGVWGNTFKVGDLRGNTVCLDCGARALDSWMNSNRFKGGGALEGHASATDPTYGMIFDNQNSGGSGNDNVIDGDISFQNLDFGIWSDQPHYAVLLSGRFEDVVKCFSFEGSGDDANATAVFLPSHTRGITTAVERRAGTNQWMDLRFDRHTAPLMWGGHPMVGFKAAFYTMPTADGAPDWRHSGGHITTDAPITIPNEAGWRCTLEPGANTHDITHNALTLDISAAGFAAGEQYDILVKAGNAIRVTGPAGSFTEADFV